MNSYLAERFQISLLTFHVFHDGDLTLLARQVEVTGPQARRTPSSKAANLELLLIRLKSMKLDNLFDRISAAIRERLENPYEWPNRTGYTYYLQDLSESGSPINYAYVSIFAPDNPKGSLLLTIQERATKAAGDYWHHAVKAFATRLIKRKGYYDVKITSEKEWYEIEKDVLSLCEAIVKGRRAMRELRIASERQGAKEEIAEEAHSQ